MYIQYADDPGRRGFHKYSAIQNDDWSLQQWRVRDIEYCTEKLSYIDLE